jgi:hypothetical protein
MDSRIYQDATGGWIVFDGETKTTFGADEKAAQQAYRRLQIMSDAPASVPGHISINILLSSPLARLCGFGAILLRQVKIKPVVVNGRLSQIVNVSYLLVNLLLTVFRTSLPVVQTIESVI